VGGGAAQAAPFKAQPALGQTGAGAFHKLDAGAGGRGGLEGLEDLGRGVGAGAALDAQVARALERKSGARGGAGQLNAAEPANQPRRRSPAEEGLRGLAFDRQQVAEAHLRARDGDAAVGGEGGGAPTETERGKGLHAATW